MQIKVPIWIICDFFLIEFPNGYQPTLFFFHFYNKNNIMPSPLETWFTDIPPITRIYISLSFITSIAVVSKRSSSKLVHIN